MINDMGICFEGTKRILYLYLVNETNQVHGKLGDNMSEQDGT